MLAIWVTFAPCFLWIFLGAPFVEALRNNRLLASALAAITAAVVGVILNLALWFALHVLFGEVRVVRAFGATIDVPVPATVNLPSAILMAMAVLAIFRFKIGMLPVLAACSLAGVLYYLVTGTMS